MTQTVDADQAVVGASDDTRGVAGGDEEGLVQGRCLRI